MNLKWWKPKLDDSVEGQLGNLSRQIEEYQKSISTSIHMRPFFDFYPFAVWFHKNRKFWHFRKITKKNGTSILILKLWWFVITIDWKRNGR